MALNSKKDILTAITEVIPHKRKPSGNWTAFNCPSCGDRRGRGCFMATATGGWRYHCFNGGCEFETATGWEPNTEYGFGGRPRKLFELLGGDPRDISFEQLFKQEQVFKKTGQSRSLEARVEVALSFGACALPRGSIPLLRASQPRAEAVLRYLHNRGGDFLVNRHPFMWTPDKPDYLLIPYLHQRDEIVGYLGRHIHKKQGEPFRFIQECAPDYLFNQHLIPSHRGRKLFVVESVLEAIMLGCVSPRGAKFTQKQINLLKMSGKDVVLIPDRDKKESRFFIDTAIEHNWLVACPRLVPRIEGQPVKDILESVVNNGLLFTIELLMNSIKPASVAKVFYNMI